MREQKSRPTHMGLREAWADVANRKMLQSVATCPYYQDSNRNVSTISKKMATAGSRIERGSNRGGQLTADSSGHAFHLTQCASSSRHLNALASGKRKTDALMHMHLTPGHFLWVQMPPLPHTCSDPRMISEQDQAEMP